MPGGPQSCPFGDSPSSLGATSPLLLSLLELLALLVSVGYFIRTRLLTSPWDSYPIASLPSPLSSQHILAPVGSLLHCYMRLTAECPLTHSLKEKPSTSPDVSTVEQMDISVKIVLGHRPNVVNAIGLEEITRKPALNPRRSEQPRERPLKQREKAKQLVRSGCSSCQSI